MLKKEKMVVLLSGIVVGLGILGSSVVEAANINGSFQENSDFSIEVEGKIGKKVVDPETKPPTFPVNPSLMISVDLPKKIAFGAIDNNNIVSADHEIINNSYLPVEVKVADYVAANEEVINSLKNFNELSLETDYVQGSNIQLVENEDEEGKENDEENSILMKLSAGNDVELSDEDTIFNEELLSNNWSNMAAFEFSGTVNATFFNDSVQEGVTVNHILKLKFSPLTSDGENYWDGNGYVSAP